MFTFSERSLNNLKGVHPKLVAVVHRALEISPIDFTVLEGVRSQERQNELWAQGRTKRGPVVTWVQTSGTHGIQADGYGHAVDLAPYPIDWNDYARFDSLANIMFAAAKELGVTLRWGGNWDMDATIHESGESDSPHYELFNQTP
jgi:peptidoglycan L-alanyl-D-glutamate endopeptidase CwlK